MASPQKHPFYFWLLFYSCLKLHIILIHINFLNLSLMGVMAFLKALRPMICSHLPL